MRSQSCRSAEKLSLAAIVLLSMFAPANAASPEQICLKGGDPTALDELAIACYSDQGCAYVEQHNGETLRDYDEASVAAALGREKIEGIVTSSDPIMKTIKGYGYSCVPLP
jgi:hypothetical protein